MLQRCDGATPSGPRQDKEEGGWERQRKDRITAIKKRKINKNQGCHTADEPKTVFRVNCHNIVIRLTTFHYNPLDNIQTHTLACVPL